MARGSNYPHFSIATSVAIKKGKYKKGPSFGLWKSDAGPMARGSVKEDYLEELVEFLTEAQEKDRAVSFALFKNGKKAKTRDDDDDEDDDDEEEEEDDDDEDEEEDDEDEEEEEEKPKKRKGKKSKKSGRKGKKKGGKKKGWDFD